ncbi:MFS transporter [Francisella tularensis subsp. novicida]|uniref:MFS transporter n=1 Tax=Francisella tularensis TaxID=263 RepID=UPI000158AD0F|nr:MFS transporter [Francisella tularensis]AJI45015.1 sugar (and other) transporter family protein [Francisella tularensis subsp. novicida F6168]AJJ46862.1 sugar (and other) transporter family protein [Francisella tularensis subsp. novicida]APC99667.1 sugar (and other) transporter family protein [Francisella tularensis subsp. novicida]AVC43465.1 MFS transporter [Francisella tularensis subsp. novicida]EDN35390.1 metabolite:H+ symporter family protein [Francisella tularensis subsp. novicida GA99
MSKSNFRKNILPALVGNISDWYEFYMYGMFAAPVIAKLFLPQQEYFIALLYTYLTFTLGFFIRPLGALFFGYFSDKYGRKKILFYSLLLMGIPTLFMALLPTYASIGIYAPIFLMLIRILQGFAVGGEIGGAAAFILESSNKNRQNISGALLISSSFFALLLASSISYCLLKLLSNNQILEWGWRIPFIFGFIIILSGLYIRYKSSETQEFLDLKTKKATIKNPISDAIKYEWNNMIITFFLSSLIAVLVFMGISYMPTYASHYLHYDFKHVLLICTLNIIVLMLSSIIFGYIADRIGGKKVLMYSCIVLFIAALPIYQIIIKNHQLVSIAIFSLAIISGAVIGPIFANTAGLFPVRNRNTGFGISFNISVSLFGGTVAFLMTLLITTTGNYLIPAFYIMFLCIPFFIALLFIPKGL